MRCYFPSCESPAEHMVVLVATASSGGCVELVTGVAVCPDHIPSVDDIGPGMKGFLEAELDKRSPGATIEFSVGTFAVSSARGRAFFAKKPN